MERVSDGTDKNNPALLHFEWIIYLNKRDRQKRSLGDKTEVWEIKLNMGNTMDNIVKPYRSAAGASSGGGGTIFFGVWGGAPSTQTFYFITVPRCK